MPQGILRYINLSNLEHNIIEYLSDIILWRHTHTPRVYSCTYTHLIKPSEDISFQCLYIGLYREYGGMYDMCVGGGAMIPL